MYNTERTFKKTNNCESYYANIHIAGNIDFAKNCLRMWTMQGACVQLIECDYIYTGGAESGMIVRLSQYPRFKRKESEIHDMAIELGKYLAQQLCQISFTIETTYETTYYQADGYEKRS